MIDINDGGPAFPTPIDQFTQAAGMTLRDYFAAKAMEAMLNALAQSRGDTDFMREVRSVSEMSFYVADAMLVARDLKARTP